MKLIFFKFWFDVAFNDKSDGSICLMNKIKSEFIK